jgi:ribosome-associated translation inhibitor RaiA
MKIEIIGLGNDPALASHVRDEVAAKLGRLGVEPTTVEVRFFDDDGPKGGPAMRCAITLRMPRRRGVHAEDTAITARAAFDGAFEAIQRRIESDRERLRDRRRRPKKYYVAKRLLEGGGEQEETAS